VGARNKKHYHKRGSGGEREGQEESARATEPEPERRAVLQEKIEE